MDLVANSVARPRKNNSIFCSDILKVVMVIRIFEADLERVVIDIAYRSFGFYMVDT